MDNNNGLIFAFVLDGQGGGKAIEWQDIRTWSEDDGILWMHLDYTAPDAEKWLNEESGLDEVTVSVLISEDPRPRSVVTNDSLLAILRGVNLNPGADPEDMVSVRLWMNDKRIISTRRRRILSINDLSKAIEQGQGPATSGEFLSEITSRMVERMSDIVSEIDDKADDLEDQVLTVQGYQLMPMISELRRETIGLRRYLAPQREAMTRLYNERLPWLKDMERMRLREAADSTMRYIEELDAARDRAIVIQEELMSRISEQMDKRMYVLSMVAAIFLPLGFLTGLLGINVGGIPGAEFKWSFLIFCLMLLLTVFVQVMLFKKMKWM